MKSSSPPLYVWFLVLIIFGILGVIAAIVFFIVDDPLSYLAFLDPAGRLIETRGSG